MWQPIETAPKDRWVFLRGGSPAYDADEAGYIPPMVVARFSLERGRWHFAWYDGGVYGDYANPTEWAEMTAA